MAIKMLDLFWTGAISVKRTYITLDRCGYEFIVMLKRDEGIGKKPCS